jgi:hypothetical protein
MIEFSSDAVGAALGGEARESRMLAVVSLCGRESRE